MDPSRTEAKSIKNQLQENQIEFRNRLLQIRELRGDSDLRRKYADIVYNIPLPPSDEFRMVIPANTGVTANTPSPAKAVIPALLVTRMITHDEYSQLQLLNAAARLPDFPWPAPKASTHWVASTKFLAPIESKSNKRTLTDVASALERKLQLAGYTERSYFSIPNGFAVVTKLERINEDGTINQKGDRWALEDKPLKFAFDINAYFRALFTADPGHYRAFAFYVTNRKSIFDGNPAHYDNVKDWTHTGGNSLLNEHSNVEYSEDYNCTVSVYSYERPKGGDPILLDPSPIDARTHVINAGMYND